VSQNERSEDLGTEPIENLPSRKKKHQKKCLNDRGWDRRLGKIKKKQNHSVFWACEKKKKIKKKEKKKKRKKKKR